MSNMFYFAESFNGDISTWDVSNVTTMFQMLRGASSFNQNISNWNVSSVTDMSYIFTSALVFNQDLSGWDVDQVTSCLSFNGTTPGWSLPKPNFTSCTP